MGFLKDGSPFFLFLFFVFAFFFPGALNRTPLIMKGLSKLTPKCQYITIMGTTLEEILELFLVYCSGLLPFIFCCNVPR